MKEGSGASFKDTLHPRVQRYLSDLSITRNPDLHLNDRQNADSRILTFLDDMSRSTEMGRDLVRWNEYQIEQIKKHE